MEISRLSEEEKKAIDILKDFNDGYTFQQCQTCFKFNEKDSCCNKEKCEELQAIETVLNLVKKQQEEIEVLKWKNKIYVKSIKSHKRELEKKDKIIDLMARAIDSYDSQLIINSYKDKEHVKETFEQYFENKVEGSK